MKWSECRAKIEKILQDDEIDIFVGTGRLNGVISHIVRFIHSEWGLEKD